MLPKQEVFYATYDSEGISRQPQRQIHCHLPLARFHGARIAALAHIPGKELAKTVMVKMDHSLIMAVLPASFHVDLSRLKAEAMATTVELASESEFKDRFPDCETGAMPPFGNLYGIKVFADESLAKDKEIAFNAGSHRELVRLAWEEFEKLVKPKIIKFAAEQSAKRRPDSSCV